MNAQMARFNQFFVRLELSEQRGIVRRRTQSTDSSGEFLIYSAGSADG